MPEGRSVYAAVPHTCWLVQQAHSATEELVYRFLRSLKPRFHTPDGAPVVQASYNEIRRGCNFQWRTTSRRIADQLRAKHSVRLAASKHEGGKRRSGEGNNTATYWVLPRWAEVLGLRRADPKIGKDQLGRVWVIGRGKHFLSPEQVEEWKLNEDYQCAPVPAYIPRGGEDEYAEWSATAETNELPTETHGAPQPRQEYPPGESPPGQLKPGKVKRPPETLMEFAEAGTKQRPGWTYVWKFYEEMKAEAARHGYELTLETLAKAMRLQLRKLGRKPDRFSYYYTVRELLTPDVLEAEGCTRLAQQQKAG